MNKPLFHEATQAEIDELVSSGKTWNDIMAIYDQPEWCTYPEALRGTLGCWSLVDISKDGCRTKISHEYCKDCDCYNGKKPTP